MPAAGLERLEEAFAVLDAPAVRRRMLVVVNPHATTMSDRLRSLVVAALASRYDVTAVDTEAQGHAIELARTAVAQDYDVVVAFGGDGTLNEVANGLAGTPVPLSVLPGGATNVFCKMLGIPGEIVDATEHLLRVADAWAPRRVDLASVNGRWFTFAAGFGLDAAIVRAVDLRPARKHRLGEWYFAWAAIRTFLAHYVVRPPIVEALLDGAPLRGIDVVVQNGTPFTYFGDRPLDAAEGASLESGDLAGLVLHRAGPVDVPTVAARLLSRRLRVLGHPQISGFAGRTELVARVAGGRGGPVPLQVDGDWIGDVTEARFTIAPRALTVVA